MDNIDRQRNRTLALAGVLQAAHLVKQLAWKGSINQDELGTCIYSLFQTNPADVEAVYNGAESVSTGIKALQNLMSDSTNKDREIARYTYSLIHLERLLAKKPQMLNTLQRGIDRAQHQAQHFSMTHDNVIANLASIYTDTISTLKFRIHVTGENAYLSNSNTVNKIRTILLAGIRSAVLWRQLGGSNWQLVFGKRAMLQDAKQLLQKVTVDTY